MPTSARPAASGPGSQEDSCGADAAVAEQPRPDQGLRFWAIVASLAFTSLCSSIEGTIITSALPAITDALSDSGDSSGSSSRFVWVPNAYFLATIVALPLMAQASNLFGRRWLTLGSVALFTLGSGICGGASGQAMLIGGRVVQGLGGGGVALMINVVLTDLVPLRERGRIMAIVQMVSAVGAAVGPFIGGLLAQKNRWRWVFYINLPIGGAALVALFFTLRVKSPEQSSFADKMSRIDFLGSAIFMASVVSVLLGVTWGGSAYAWSSYHVLVPLVFGFAGIGLFLAYEWNLAASPSLPRAAVWERTAATVLAVTFLATLCTYWAFYFVPVYLQGVLGRSAFWSGVDTLPLFTGLFPSAILGGVLLSRWGRYKPLHLVGMAVLTVSYGLFSTLDQRSSTAAWACYQLLCALGAGLVIAILLPAMQAPLPEHLVALSTGVWTFVRGFSTVWGVTIPSAIFSNAVSRKLGGVANQTLAAQLQGGRAYQYATKAFLDSIDSPSDRDQVVQVFSNSMKTVWRVGTAFAGLGWLLVWLEREVTLRSKLNTKFGMEQKTNKMGLEEGKIGEPKDESVSETAMQSTESDGHVPPESQF